MCELFGMVEPVPETGCWLWAGRIDKCGYGHLYFNHRNDFAHRVFYKQMRGPIPPGMFVCHKCDTPTCVNPDHLFLGTPKQNTHDMLKKGRRPAREGKHIFKARGKYKGGWKRGELNVNAKLTPAQIKEIRAVHAPFPYDEYAQRLGVSRSTLWYARSGRNWREVCAAN